MKNFSKCKIFHIIVITIFYIISIYGLSKWAFYQQSEIQGKYNIDSVIYCINHNPDKNFYNKLDACMKKQRNFTPNSDMFVMRKNDYKIIYDASMDCKVDKKMSFLTKNKICALFYEPDSCVRGAKLMKNKRVGDFDWYFYEYPENIFFKTFIYQGEKYVIASGLVSKQFYSHFTLIYVYLILIYFITIYFVWRYDNGE